MPRTECETKNNPSRKVCILITSISYLLCSGIQLSCRNGTWHAIRPTAISVSRVVSVALWEFPPILVSFAAVHVWFPFCWTEFTWHIWHGSPERCRKETFARCFAVHFSWQCFLPCWFQLWDVHVQFNCAGSHKVWVAVLVCRTLLDSCDMSVRVSTEQARTKRGSRSRDPFVVRFSCKFSHKIAFLRCPCAFRLHRLAQSAGRGQLDLGLGHFTWEFSHIMTLVTCPCAFRLRRLAQNLCCGACKLLVCGIFIINSRINGSCGDPAKFGPKRSLHAPVQVRSWWDPF